MTHCHSPLWFKFISALLQMMDSATNSFPSILSHMTNTFLNHEALALPVLPKRRGIPPLQTFAPLKSILPCDFHLLNLRSIQSQVKWHAHTTFLVSGILWLDPTWFCLCVCEQQDPQSPSPYTAMILHRLAVDCGLEAQNLGFNCTTTQGQVRVDTHTRTLLQKSKTTIDAVSSLNFNLCMNWRLIGFENMSVLLLITWIPKYICSLLLCRLYLSAMAFYLIFRLIFNIKTYDDLIIYDALWKIKLPNSVWSC